MNKYLYTTELVVHGLLERHLVKASGILVGCVWLISSLKSSEWEVQVPLFGYHFRQVFVEALGSLKPLHHVGIDQVFENLLLLVVIKRFFGHRVLLQHVVAL